MAEEHIVSGQHDDEQSASETHQRTLTDLIDEIKREAFSRSLSKRPDGTYQRYLGTAGDD